MREILFIDFETRSAADLSALGSHKYCFDPTTSVLLAAFAFNDEPVVVCAPDDLPAEVWGALDDPRVLKIAHNAEFDMCVCKYLLGVEIGLDQWHDTAYQAAYFGLPRSLKDLANVLGTKQKASQEELRLFSSPVKRKLKKETSDAAREFNRLTRLLPTEWANETDEPEAWARFIEYARGDVEVMRECLQRMAPLPEIEREAMHETFLMNFTGVPFDSNLANRIMELVHRYEAEAAEEAERVHGITNLRSNPQVQAALQRDGLYLPSLNAKTRGAVSHPILDLRDRATGAAFRKLPKAIERVCADGRIRGEFVGYGAHTGRWSSRGVQLQNWARIMSEVSESLEKVGSYDHLRQHLRLCLGHDKNLAFTCADLSQIEARIVAYLAGCKWLIAVFASGGDPYSTTAKKMFGGECDPNTGRHPKRQYGKNAVLGFGYGGGGAAIERIDKKFFDEIGAAAAQNLCYTYRDAHPEIVGLWHKLDKAWREAMRTAVSSIYCNGVSLKFTFDGRNMRITLPSGRALYYRDVRTLPGEYKPEIVYADHGDGHVTWRKVWHGVIIENVVQAMARDVLIEALVRARKRVPESQIVGSVHDEGWFLHPPSIDMLSIVLEEMARPIEWAPGLVTKGDGFTSDRYRK